MVLIYVRFFVAVILDAYRSPRIQYCIQSLYWGIRSPLDLTLPQLPCKSQLPQLQRGLRFRGLGPYTALQRVNFPNCSEGLGFGVQVPTLPCKESASPMAARVENLTLPRKESASPMAGTRCKRSGRGVPPQEVCFLKPKPQITYRLQGRDAGAEEQVAAQLPAAPSARTGQHPTSNAHQKKCINHGFQSWRTACRRDEEFVGEVGRLKRPWVPVLSLFSIRTLRGGGASETTGGWQRGG
jgi:hypothetical protein